MNGFKNSNPYHYDRGTQSYATGNIDYISTIASMTPSDFITCDYEVLSNLEMAAIVCFGLPSSYTWSACWVMALKFSLVKGIPDMA